jgi:glutathione S-transferase
MFGATPVEKALVDMWVRRTEFTVMMPVGQFWRHAHPRTAGLLNQFKDFGESNKETYKGAQRFLNRELEGRTWLASDSYSIADICLLTTIDFAKWIGLPLEDENEHLLAWHERAKSRPSARA